VSSSFGSAVTGWKQFTGHPQYFYNDDTNHGTRAAASAFKVQANFPACVPSAGRDVVHFFCRIYPRPIPITIGTAFRPQLPRTLSVEQQACLPAGRQDAMSSF